MTQFKIYSNTEKKKVKYKIIGKVFDWPYSIQQAKWHIRTFLQKDLDSPFSCLSFREKDLRSCKKTFTRF